VEDTVALNRKQFGSLDWTQLPHSRIIWQAVVNTIMSLPVRLKMEYFKLVERLLVSY
jgi:hypothetical protein